MVWKEALTKELSELFERRTKDKEEYLDVILKSSYSIGTEMVLQHS